MQMGLGLCISIWSFVEWIFYVSLLFSWFGLKDFGGVYIRSVKVVFISEVLYFGFILLSGENDYRISSFSCGYRGTIVFLV